MNARLRFAVVSALTLCLGFDWPGQAARLSTGLDSPDPRKRREIVRWLSATGSGEARSMVVKACTDSDPGVRREALQAAGELGATEAIQALLKALSDPDAGLRATAAEALGAMGAAEAEQALARALADAEAPVRRAAVGALARLPQGGQLAPLMACLDDVDPEVRVAALRALGPWSADGAHDAVLGKTRDATPEVRAAALDAIASTADPRARDALSHALDDSADVVVLAAIRGLRRLPEVDTRALMTPLARSPRVRVAAAARLSLEQAAATAAAAPAPNAQTQATWLPWLERTVDPTADPSAILLGLEATLPAGEALALDPLLLYEPRVPQAYRARLAALLGRTKAPGAGPALVKMLDDASGVVRAAAASALGELGTPAHSVRLLGRLADSDERVRAAAAESIGAIADLSALRVLLDRSEQASQREDADGSPTLDAITGCLRRLRTELSARDRERLRAVLAAWLKRPSADAQVKAVRALGELGDAGAVQTLLQVDAHARIGLRVAAARALLRADHASALSGLRTLRDSGAVPVRATAIAALGLAGDASDLPALQQALSEGPWPVGPVAGFGLASLVMRGHASSDALCPLLKADEPVTRDNAGAALRARPSAQCARVAAPEPGDDSDHTASSLNTWRALVLTDGRVLISHPDALGDVTLPSVSSVRSESPWRRPYGVHWAPM